MKSIHISFPAIILVVLLLGGCAVRQDPGFTPPTTKNPLAAHELNWSRISTISGAYRIVFHYSDGEKVGLRGDIVLEPGLRARVDLSSDRGAEAIVSMTPAFINLLNHREKYYIREASSRENCNAIVGIHLPSEEAASVLSGEGFQADRFEHIYQDVAAEGGVILTMFHKTEKLKAEAWLDQFGRLRTVTYTDSDTEIPLLKADYLQYKHERGNNCFRPGKIVISLLDRGEQIELLDRDIDINSAFVKKRLDSYIFAPLERGTRLQLEQIPPGAPVLYRNLKVYIKDEE